MTALEWLRNDSERPIRPVYTIFGTDSYLVREAIGHVVAAVFPGEASDAAVSRFPGATTQLATVLDEVCTLPFFAQAAGHRR